MWRPKKKNWGRDKDKIILQYIAGADPDEPDLGDIFEAGADAMLKALFEKVGGENDKGGGVLWFGKTDSGDLLIYTQP